jgi:hypothetical protein
MKRTRHVQNAKAIKCLGFSGGILEIWIGISKQLMIRKLFQVDVVFQMMTQNGNAMSVVINGEKEKMTKVDPFYEYVLKSLKKRRRTLKVEEEKID